MTETDYTIQGYHQRTKHQLERYARGPETLDWDNQPDPFRHFQGSPRRELPLPAAQDRTPYYQLSRAGERQPQPLDRMHIGKLLELSMALSAWKSYGPDRWSLRINPSSGNLHPTECYLLLPPGAEISAGLYHYHSYAHELEQRCDLQPRSEQLQAQLPGGTFIIGLSSIHKRESWKYGERAYRYCQHDVGHAVAAIRYACAVLGWQLTLLDECSDAQIAHLLGLDRATDFSRAEHESPDLLLQIDSNANDVPRVDIDSLLQLAADCDWAGQANRLTDDNFYKWPVIQQAEAACSKPLTPASQWLPTLASDLPACDASVAAADIIRQRRSAQAFEAGAPPLPLQHFDRMLQCLLPRAATPPLDCLPWAPRLHVILFVHRVEGLAPGLYALPRSEHGALLLREQLRDEFAWEPVGGIGAPLFLLLGANAANSARTLACHQPIASDSAFSLAMLAEFDATLASAPWRYRQLHWEAGVIGQSLYLEAEAAGVRGTGIGCYFDDAVHELLGIRGSGLQDLYHFTVGTPRIDTRLQSESAYGHLQR
ncbi:MAG: SagB/ThcOx family dehydrogenase [Granulosicoccaceae bacterium]|jgi:SagB-type dehydrogenase family enzyme